MISLILLASATEHPKFHYNDCVVVNQGFYYNCKGKVKRYYEFSSSKYDVELSNCGDGAAHTESFKEEELDHCEQSK